METEEMADKAHEGANRWTDNVFMLQKWCGKNMDPGELKSGFKQLGYVGLYLRPARFRHAPSNVGGFRQDGVKLFSQVRC